jgi:hypothetical protein
LFESLDDAGVVDAMGSGAREENADPGQPLNAAFPALVVIEWA